MLKLARLRTFFLISPAMSKRARSASLHSNPEGDIGEKKSKVQTTFNPPKVASASAAAAVDHTPPLAQLLKAVEGGVKQPENGTCVVYWMRMADLRSEYHFTIYK